MNDDTDQDVTDAMQLLDNTLDTFNSGAAEIRARYDHYPHIRIAGPEIHIWQSPEEYARDTSIEALSARNRTPNSGGWVRTRYDKREVLQRSEEAMHVLIVFSRVDERDQPVLTFETLWILTKRNGAWGVQARSSFGGAIVRPQ